jgi:CDP-diglyceride synthetase
MSDASSPSDLSARVKTGFPLAAGIALLLFSPTFVVGLLVLVVTFIGAQELTSMLAKAKGDETPGLLPEWLLPGTAVLMGLGALAGQTGLHASLIDQCSGLDIL